MERFGQLPRHQKPVIFSQCYNSYLLFNRVVLKSLPWPLNIVFKHLVHAWPLDFKDLWPSLLYLKFWDT